jgi:hypothetical protein
MALTRRSITAMRVVTDAPDLPGFVRVDPLDGDVLDHALYWGSRNDELDHWFYVTKSSAFHGYSYGIIVPGSFEKEIVMTILKSIDLEMRKREELIRQRAVEQIRADVERFDSRRGDGPW